VSEWDLGGDSGSGSGSGVINVLAYGADPTGTSDSTIAIQAAVNAAPPGSTILFPPGTYIVTPVQQPNTSYAGLNIPKSLLFQGWGATLKIKNGSVQTADSTFLCYVSGSPSLVGFSDITLDANAANQTLTGMSNAINLCGIASRNASQAGILVLRNVTVNNFSAVAGGSSNYSGIGVDDYGFSEVRIDGTLKGNNCDTVYWHTTIVANSGLCKLTFDKIIGKNLPSNTSARVLYIETCGQVYGDSVLNYADASGSAYGVVINTGASGDLADVHINDIAGVNGLALLIGLGGSNYLTYSSFGNVSATGAASVSCVYISQTDPTVWFGCIEADATNAATIVSIHSATGHYPILNCIKIGAPMSGASLDGNAGPASILGGYCGGTLQNVTLGPVRNVVGYNPIGVVTVAVPANGNQVAAVNYDRTFYITNGTAQLTLQIQSGPAIVVPALGQATVELAAGLVMSYTYAAGTPTQVVQGN